MKAKPFILTLEILEKANPAKELHTTLVGTTALELPRISNWWMLVMVRFTLREWVPGKNCSVRFESLKYCPGSCAYSESVWQGCRRQEVFVDVGLTWRVTPWVSEGRASRTTVRARERTPSSDTIVGKLLRWEWPIIILYRLQKQKLKARVSFFNFRSR